MTEIMSGFKFFVNGSVIDSHWYVPRVYSNSSSNSLPILEVTVIHQFCVLPTFRNTRDYTSLETFRYNFQFSSLAAFSCSAYSPNSSGDFSEFSCLIQEAISVLVKGLVWLVTFSFLTSKTLNSQFPRYSSSKWSWYLGIARDSK